MRSWFWWLALCYPPQWYVWPLSTSRSFTNTEEALTEYIWLKRMIIGLKFTHKLYEIWIAFLVFFFFFHFCQLITSSYCSCSKATWNLNITCEGSHEPYVYSLHIKFNHVYVFKQFIFSRIVNVNNDYFKSYHCFDFNSVFLTTYYILLWCKIYDT